jgi:hypothetical protein
MASKRDKNHGRAILMLHNLGFATLSDPTLPVQARGGFESGRPDIWAIRNAVGVCVECKRFTERFPFSAWTERQRKWAEEHDRENGVPYWLYITLGMNVNSKLMPQKTWLLPYTAMLEVERVVGQYQQSLPYIAGKGMRREIQEQHLDAVTMLRGYELMWNKELKCFMPPAGHLFMVLVK